MTGRREWSKDWTSIMAMLKLLAVCVGLMAWVPPAGAQAQAPEDTARVIHQSWLGNSKLKESSGLVASRREPGLLWTLNDSGNPPELFATDSSGKDRGAFRVETADNRDWEALGLARCGSGDCLYIAEVGDNSTRYPTVRIYRVVEPARPTAPGGAVRPNGVIEFTYQDGPQNVEAILVTPSQDVILISKERSGGGRVYLLDHGAWSSREVATARFVQELPLPEGMGFQVTDAALAREGIDVAVRTYSYIFFFKLENGRLNLDQGRPRCYAAGLDAQGEGITWLPNGRLATSSERISGLGGTVSIVECR
jgi:hypothetical protein